MITYNWLMIIDIIILALAAGTLMSFTIASSSKITKFCFALIVAAGISVIVCGFSIQNETQLIQAIQQTYDKLCKTGYTVYLDNTQVAPETINPIDYRHRTGSGYLLNCYMHVINTADTREIHFFSDEKLNWDGPWYTKPWYIIIDM